jgi:hypothetical protein
VTGFDVASMTDDPPMKNSQHLAGLPPWLAVVAESRWRDMQHRPNWRALWHEVWTPDGPSSRIPAKSYLAAKQRLDAVCEDVGGAILAADWSIIPPAAVVRMFGWSVATDLAMREMVPVEAGPDRLARALVFFETQLRIGLLVELQHGKVDAAMEMPLSYLAGFVAGPPAWAEIVRRGRHHEPGVAAAFLRLCQELRADGLIGPDHATERWAVDRLHRGARAYITTSEARADCFGQIPLTVQARWGAFDPLQAITDALEGGLDIAPKAIADDVFNELQKVRRWQDREQSAADADGLQLQLEELDWNNPRQHLGDRLGAYPGPAKPGVATRRDRALRQRNRLTVHQQIEADMLTNERRVLVDAYRASSPTGRADVAALLDAASVPDQAAAAGVTERAIKKGRAKAKKRFHQWLAGRPEKKVRKVVHP